MLDRDIYRLAILDGIQIDAPNVFIPWDLCESEVRKIFLNYQVSHIVDAYYAIKDVRIFNTLVCNIGLHFDKALSRVEFFRNDYADLHKSYNEFQKVFIGKFGKPSRRSRASAGFDSCEWDIDNRVKISHFVMDRFGLTEYMFIEKTSM